MSAALFGAPMALAGCGSGSATPEGSGGREIVLIQSTRPVGPAVTLACGARAQASRLGYRLSVERLARPVASDQIAVVNAVIAAKPAAVVISPDGAATPAASLQSLRSAGIVVVEITPDARAGDAQAGAGAVRRAVSALRGKLSATALPHLAGC